MKRYTVVVSRSFEIDIDAENAASASKLAELFLGYSDESTADDQLENNFKILSIDMLENDAIEVRRTG